MNKRMLTCEDIYSLYITLKVLNGLNDDYTFINESLYKELQALEACEPTGGSESVLETAGQILC